MQALSGTLRVKLQSSGRIGDQIASVRTAFSNGHFRGIENRSNSPAPDKLSGECIWYLKDSQDTRT